ncbi:ATP binding protein [[Candida] boidinii]|nr:ATP binding protein [[Candida] boidinii]
MDRRNNNYHRQKPQQPPPPPPPSSSSSHGSSQDSKKFLGFERNSHRDSNRNKESGDNERYYRDSRNPSDNGDLIWDSRSSNGHSQRAPPPSRDYRNDTRDYNRERSRNPREYHPSDREYHEYHPSDRDHRYNGTSQHPPSHPRQPSSTPASQPRERKLSDIIRPRDESSNFADRKRKHATLETSSRPSQSAPTSNSKKDTGIRSPIIKKALPTGPKARTTPTHTQTKPFSKHEIPHRNGISRPINRLNQSSYSDDSDDSDEFDFTNKLRNNNKKPIRSTPAPASSSSSSSSTAGTTTRTNMPSRTLLASMEKNHNQNSSSSSPSAQASAKSQIVSKQLRDISNNNTYKRTRHINYMESIKGIDGPVHERIQQVGEGTYGKVYKAKNRVTNSFVALKRLRLETEREGFPITASREIGLLQSFDHPNIVGLSEMMVEKNSIYMVFPYMDHDLSGLLQQHNIAISDGEKKNIFKQLLKGMEYLHMKRVIHRDIKGSNILVNNMGLLKITDFGLARTMKTLNRDIESPNYTNRVITLWYRPPEILLGSTDYGREIDIWGIGCILMELFTRSAIFQGVDEVDQLWKVYDIMGTITIDDWPEADQLPWFEMLRPNQHSKSKFDEQFSSILTPKCFDLAKKLLKMNPNKRITASDALKHEYFTEEPLEAPLEFLKNVEGEWHEFEAKKKRRKERELRKKINSNQSSENLSLVSQN